MKRNLFGSIIMLFGLFAVAKIWFVSPAGNDQNTGVSWEQAFYKISSALEMVEAGDSVYALQGVYYEHEVNIPSEIHVLGGFDGTEHSYLERDFRNNKTIIDLDSRPSSRISNSGNLDGFTIQFGGTIRSVGALQNCTICHNQFENTLISAGTVRGCRIYKNTCTGYLYDGAVLGLRASGSVKNTLIYDNYSGGIMASDYNSVRYVTCVENKAFGLRISSSSRNANIFNSIFAYNDGKDIVDWSSNTNFVRNCCYLTLYGTLECDEDNLVSDPLFVNVLGESDTWDLHLSKESPCIDTGNTMGNSSHDIDGITRPFGEGFDIGAYEYYYETDVPMSGWMHYQ